MLSGLNKQKYCNLAQLQTLAQREVELVQRIGVLEGEGDHMCRELKGASARELSYKKRLAIVEDKRDADIMILPAPYSSFLIPSASTCISLSLFPTSLSHFLQAILAELVAERDSHLAACHALAQRVIKCKDLGNKVESMISKLTHWKMESAEEGLLMERALDAERLQKVCMHWVMNVIYEEQCANLNDTNQLVSRVLQENMAAQVEGLTKQLTREKEMHEVVKTENIQAVFPMEMILDRCKNLSLGDGGAFVGV